MAPKVLSHAAPGFVAIQPQGRSKDNSPNNEITQKIQRLVNICVINHVEFWKPRVIYSSIYLDKRIATRESVKQVYQTRILIRPVLIYPQSLCSTCIEFVLFMTLSIIACAEA